MPRRIPLPCQELHHLYLEEGLSMSVIGARLGCSAATIANRLRNCGIPTRSGRFVARPIERALIEQLYNQEGLPLATIAARLGVSISTVHNRRRAYGIPARPRPRPTRKGKQGPQSH